MTLDKRLGWCHGRGHMNPRFVLLVCFALLGMAVLLAMCGCSGRAPETASRIGGSRIIITFRHEGHEYLASYYGGLLHSQSCYNAGCMNKQAATP